ncbi:trans-sulfuration enzyme family protein [Paenibacillus sacheonensis]|uniref:homocysteine desulfhydrase n=1 Tax=Paenibacillus sacheonensis TaxID=742054 RepID=A0A7X4YQ08_9BACL|nr:aminotransferase class I/II-fold pyridoxal phosphate-dependent enzyme [Paenibacillus sacheonensis]MBM7566185.1 cystathionine beta-lyase/cystathionine gamma-synthase [Paenibacillus sacheonensis]NBC70393.1 aminotransferase class V-fold PLP-dependent enzyme [Paenibacillus sacheonensis]
MKARMQTMLTHFGEENVHGAVIPPIFLNSTFVHESYEAFQEGKGHYYSRVSNPTLDVLEKKLAALEQGEAAKAFASGMAAISAVLFHFLKQGDHAICSTPAYGGTFGILGSYMHKFGIAADFVDFRDTERVRAAIKPNTRLIVCESYSTFFMDVFDLEAIVSLAKEHGLRTVIDNTCATPANLRPLEWGFDVVVHSASKYLGGHSDVIAGAVIASREIIDRIVQVEYGIFGGALGPFEAWLVTRGLKTFGLRMKQHADSAMQIARMLEASDKVAKVNFPFLPGHGQHAMTSKQFDQPSGLLSFELHGGKDAAARVINRLRYFKIGVSWGGFESLAYSPGMSGGHDQFAGTEYEPRLDRLIRISVGLEDTADLIEDLQTALEAAE